MLCEVCGGRIDGASFKVKIEGAQLAVCIRCSKHGEIIGKEPLRETTAVKPRTKIRTGKPLKLGRSSKKADAPLELIDNFASKIKEAREKLGVSQDELGKKIKEKVSVIKKIEGGKGTPNNELATKLEFALKIKLLTSERDDVTEVGSFKLTAQELTLGDFFQRDKRLEDKGKRKQL